MTPFVVKKDGNVPFVVALQDANLLAPLVGAASAAADRAGASADRMNAILRASRFPRIVADYGARDSIPAADRYAGMQVWVVSDKRWFEVNSDTFNPAAPFTGNQGWRTPAWYRPPASGTIADRNRIASDSLTRGLRYMRTDLPQPWVWSEYRLAGDLDESGNPLAASAWVDLRRYGSPLIVATYGARNAIPAFERYAGLRVYVIEAGLWFEMNPAGFDPASPPTGGNGWRTAPEFASANVVYSTPPILDGGTLYFPAIAIMRYESNGYTTQAFPAAPNTYAASPVSMTSTVRRHVFDRAAFVASGSYETALIEVDDTNAPLRTTDTHIVLAVSRNGKLIDTRGTAFAGDVPGGAVANQFRYGKQVDSPGFLPGAISPVAITDPDLIALGLSQGMQGDPNWFTTYGDYRPEPFKVGDYVVARFYLKTTVAGQFGQPRLYIYKTEQQVQFFVPSVFREINPTVREYYIATRLTAPGIGKWAVGTDAQAFAGRITVAGVRFACTATPALWIGSDDYPVAPDVTPLAADEIYMTSDRRTPIFPANGLVDRGVAISATVASPAKIETASPALFVAGVDGSPIWLDPAAVGTTGIRLAVRANSDPHTVVTRDFVTWVKAVPLAGASLTTMLIGDSHSAQQMPRDVNRVLTGWGVDNTFSGTLETSIGENPGETRQYGEGRGAWGLSNFFGLRSNGTFNQVLPAGQAAVDAYRAGNYELRFRTNPFLNNGASGSTAPVIPGELPLLGGGTASGFRLDLVNYRDRFGISSALAVVLLNLGMNDVNQSGAAAGLVEIQTLYPIMLAEIRRAWPQAVIVCWSDGPGFTSVGETRWRERRPALLAMLTAVRARVAAGDTNIAFAGTWMHHAIRAGFPLTDGTVDPVTRTVKRRVYDDAHTTTPATEQVLEALASAIVNVADLPDDPVPMMALTSPVDGRLLTSPIDSRILTRAI